MNQVMMMLIKTVNTNSPVPKNFFFEDQRAKLCFYKFPILKEEYDFSEYLGRDFI